MVKKRKKNAGADAEESTQPIETVELQPLPEGYEERTSDLVGFWDPTLGPLHFVPLYVKAFDSHLDDFKPSVVVVGHSVGANKLLDADGEPIVCQPGDPIGVWYKPGMVRLKDLANVKVFLQYSGEQDTGKKNPMKTFQVSSPKNAPKGAPLILTEDYRKKSRTIQLPFETKASLRGRVDDDENFGDNPAPRRTRSNGASDNNGDINF
jgi:hypothetical protein